RTVPDKWDRHSRQMWHGQGRHSITTTSPLPEIGPNQLAHSTIAAWFLLSEQIKVAWSAQNLIVKLAMAPCCWTPAPNWPAYDRPTMALSVTFRSIPALMTAAFFAIGTPAISKVSEPAKACAESGVVSPNACRHPSRPCALAG